VDHIHRSDFYGMRLMGMEDTSMIDKINPTFIDLTAMAIHHCQSACETGEFRVQPQCGRGSGAQCKCDTSNINHRVNNASTDIFHRLNADFCSSSAEVQAKTIEKICSISRRRIHSTGTEPAMAQSHNDEGSIDEDFLDYVPEELTEQADNSFNCLSSFFCC